MHPLTLYLNLFFNVHLSTGECLLNVLVSDNSVGPDHILGLLCLLRPACTNT